MSVGKLGLAPGRFWAQICSSVFCSYGARGSGWDVFFLPGQELRASPSMQAHFSLLVGHVHQHPLAKANPVASLRFKGAGDRLSLLMGGAAKFPRVSGKGEELGLVLRSAKASTLHKRWMRYVWMDVSLWTPDSLQLFTILILLFLLPSLASESLFSFAWPQQTLRTPLLFNIDYKMFQAHLAHFLPQVWNQPINYF